MKVNSGGSLAKTPNGYRATVSLGFDPITGKRKRVTKTFPRCSKAEANRLMREWISELENGLRYDADTVTFREYAHDWQQQRETLGAVRKGTLKKDKSTIDRLCSYIGECVLPELETPTIKSLYRKMSDDGVTPGRIAEAHQKLKQILNSAVDDNLLIRNPCDRVRVPRPKQEHERQTLSAEQAARLLRAASEVEDGRGIAVWVALATGMRRGEVLGLVWDNVDLERGIITVRQQVTAHSGLSALKTDTSNRTVAIDPRTVETLSDWKERQGKYLATLWITQNGQTPVISNGEGGFYDPNHFSSWWQGFCVRNGFARWVDDNGETIQQRTTPEGWPIDNNGNKHSRSNPKPKVHRHYVGLRFHELRHTQATLLIANGTDVKTVQARLGHAKASTTIDLYAHALPENDREASDLIGSLISEAEETRKVVNI